MLTAMRNGLGLYICKQLMQMDGDIFMTQEQGCDFHLVPVTLWASNS